MGLAALKLIADIGLLGLPNAGKSTLLSKLSRARKIADYPFTTLHPNLGVVGNRGREFVMADIPGLIEGASDGAGLGHRFLGHVERCAALLHLVDATQQDVVSAYQTIRAELVAYDAGMAAKPEFIALTKADALSADALAEQLSALAAICDTRPMVISAVSGAGLAEMQDALLAYIDAARNGEQAANVSGTGDNQIGWHPLAKSGGD